MPSNDGTAKVYQVAVRKGGETVRGQQTHDGRKAYREYVAAIGVRFGEFAEVQLRMVSAPIGESGRPFPDLERAYGFCLLGKTRTGGKRGWKD